MINPRKEVVTLQQNPRMATFTSQLGIAFSLIMECPNYRMLRVISVHTWLQMPILLKQICFFYDNLGDPIGYVTWAYISEETESRLVADEGFLLHQSEWNEGERLWIIDFAAPNGMVREIISFIRDHMFKDFLTLRYLRRGPDGAVRMVREWKINSGCVE